MDYQVISRMIDIRTVFSVIPGYMLPFLLVGNYCSCQDKLGALQMRQRGDLCQCDTATQLKSSKAYAVPSSVLQSSLLAYIC